MPRQLDGIQVAVFDPAVLGRAQQGGQGIGHHDRRHRVVEAGRAHRRGADRIH